MNDLPALGSTLASYALEVFAAGESFVSPEAAIASGVRTVEQWCAALEAARTAGNGALVSRGSFARQIARRCGLTVGAIHKRAEALGIKPLLRQPEGGKRVQSFFTALEVEHLLLAPSDAVRRGEFLTEREVCGVLGVTTKTLIAVHEASGVALPERGSMRGWFSRPYPSETVAALQAFMSERVMTKEYIKVSELAAQRGVTACAINRLPAAQGLIVSRLVLGHNWVACVDRSNLELLNRLYPILREFDPRFDLRIADFALRAGVQKRTALTAARAAGLLEVTRSRSSGSRIQVIRSAWLFKLLLVLPREPRATRVLQTGYVAAA